MPRCLHPNETTNIVLDSDAALPADQQPYFMSHALNGRQFREATRICKSLQSASIQAGPEAVDGIYEVLRLGIVGWHGMLDHSQSPPVEIPFDPKNLDLVIDPVEAGELLTKMLGAASVSPEDKKKSDSAP